VFGVLGIRCIMLFHHLIRYGLALLSGLASHGKQSEVRKQVSSACLRQLLYGAVPPKPEAQSAS
jgi:hypothetical protein